VPERRFPPPWSVEETEACFIVRDTNGQALALQDYANVPAEREAEPYRRVDWKLRQDRPL
jgi:hypothetical protein